MKNKATVVKHLKGDIKTFNKEKHEDIALLKKIRQINGTQEKKLTRKSKATQLAWTKASECVMAKNPNTSKA
jgi:hypothetical protein